MKEIYIDFLLEICRSILCPTNPNSSQSRNALRLRLQHTQHKYCCDQHYIILWEGSVMLYNKMYLFNE